MSIMNKVLCLSVLLCTVALVQAGEGLGDPKKANVSLMEQVRRSKLPLRQSSDAIPVSKKDASKKDTSSIAVATSSSGSTCSSSGSSPVGAEHLFPGERGKGFLADRR